MTEESLEQKTEEKQRTEESLEQRAAKMRGLDNRAWIGIIFSLFGTTIALSEFKPGVSIVKLSGYAIALAGALCMMYHYRQWAKMSKDKELMKVMGYKIN